MQGTALWNTVGPIDLSNTLGGTINTAHLRALTSETDCSGKKIVESSQSESEVEEDLVGTNDDIGRIESGTLGDLIFSGTTDMNDTVTVKKGGAGGGGSTVKLWGWSAVNKDAGDSTSADDDHTRPKTQDAIESVSRPQNLDVLSDSESTDDDF